MNDVDGKAKALIYYFCYLLITAVISEARVPSCVCQTLLHLYF